MPNGIPEGEASSEAEERQDDPQPSKVDEEKVPLKMEKMQDL